VYTGSSTADALLLKLEGAFAGTHFRATDLSSALVRLHLEGFEVRMVLAKGCSLDLHNDYFSPGKVARTRFAGMPVVIRCVAEFKFQLIVSTSYLEYLQT
jgi:sarcosine oxidase subunit gamma